VRFCGVTERKTPAYGIADYYIPFESRSPLISHHSSLTTHKFSEAKKTETCCCRTAIPWTEPFSRFPPRFRPDNIPGKKRAMPKQTPSAAALHPHPGCDNPKCTLFLSAARLKQKSKYLCFEN
jgi:hypothetical protein